MVVATRRDRLVGAKIMEHKQSLKKQNIGFTFEQLEEHAEREVKERVRQIEEDLLSLEGGRFDACVAVSKGNYEPTIRPDPDD